MFAPDLFRGKRILVTGGGTGLGRGMAERLLQLGADIVICGRRKEVLDTAAREMMAAHGGRVSTHAVDIRNAEAVEQMIAAIWAEAPLTGLLNNAAGNFVSRTEDLSPRAFDAIANIVLHGTFYVTNAVGKRWIAAQQPGSVVTIVTTWVWTGSPFVVPSAMSKAGLDAMTKSLAIEWGRYRIRLNAIAPGVIPTEGMNARLDPNAKSETRGAGNPMNRVGEMSEIQNLAAFLLADGCEWLTGQTIALDGAGHLGYGAQMTRYLALGDAEWAEMRAKIKAANERDKAQRSV
jgi:NAD(P)-dependent dehydrogenase (short-subunit alcohol dehydrogenase family)